MRKFISVDAEKCTGCGICELVCSSSKYKVFNPKLSLIRVTRLNLSLDAAVSCQFCEEPTCIRVCPRKALTQDQATGVVLVDENKCTGCRWCATNCEFGVMVLNPQKKIIATCDFCGGNPLCVEYCPHNALEITTLGTLSAKRRLSRARDLI